MWNIEVYDPETDSWSVARTGIEPEEVEILRQANVDDGGVEEETFRFREVTQGG